MVELLAGELALARAWTSGEPGMGLYIGCQVNVVKRSFWANEKYCKLVVRLFERPRRRNIPLYG